MRKYPRFFFWFLLVITAAAVLVDLPNTLRVGNKTIGPLHPRQKDFTFHRGLDLAGGTSVTLQADMHGIPEAQRQNALDSAKAVIEKRINLFGVSEPVIQTAKVNNEYRLIVELPGVNVDQAIQLVGTTAQLSFWEDSQKVATPSGLPVGITQILQNPHKTDLTGKDLQDATVIFDPQTGKPEVQPTFSPDGVKKFADITRRNVSKPLVIVLDNQIISAPTVQTVIPDGNTIITGGFTTDQAKALSIQLRAGALPIPLKVLEQNSVGATLGNTYLLKSLFAGILGFIIIVIFMIVLYGRLGVIASTALVLYTLITLAIFKIIPVTLTLAGIAGFILSIGMAVDANILIFERMKEELRLGRSLAVAIELGFSRAWTSIRDSNISTLITSAILYKFGTGIVRGFAITLAIGVLVSMFSAVFATRTFIRSFYKR